MTQVMNWINTWRDKVCSLWWMKRLEQSQSFWLSGILLLFLISSWMGNVVIAENGSIYYNLWYDKTSQLLRYCSYALMILAIFFNWLEKVYLFWPFILWTGVGSLAFLMSRSTELMIVVLITLSMAPLGVKKGLSLYIWVQGGVLLAGPLLVAFGVLPNPIMDADRLRYSLGFTWVTVAPVLLVFFSASLLYLYRKKISWMFFYLMIIVNTLLYLLTNTRMAFFSTFLILIVFAVRKFHPSWLRFSRSRPMLWFVLAVPVTLTLVSGLLAIFYTPSNAFERVLDGLLSGRLSNGAKAFHTYGLSLFGQPVQWVGYGAAFRPGKSVYLFVDNSYLNILINYGVFVLFAVLTWQSFMVVQAYRNRDEMAIILLLILACFSFVELRLLNPLYNPLLVASGQLFTMNWRKLYEGK